MAKLEDQTTDLKNPFTISLFHVERQYTVIFQANHHGLICIPKGTYLHTNTHLLITLPQAITLRVWAQGSGFLFKTSDNTPDILSPELQLVFEKYTEEKFAKNNS